MILGFLRRNFAACPHINLSKFVCSHALVVHDFSQLLQNNNGMKHPGTNPPGILACLEQNVLGRNVPGSKCPDW